MMESTIKNNYIVRSQEGHRGKSGILVKLWRGAIYRGPRDSVVPSSTYIEVL
jgi:hypothetical protein